MGKEKIQSVEPNIADLANGWLKSYKLNYKLEQESLNIEIDRALNDYWRIVKSSATPGDKRLPQEFSIPGICEVEYLACV